jgi:cellulose synthase/poly-beta-1,6-N-acetylglucosamine synthase-like glycosyltransferase
MEELIATIDADTWWDSGALYEPVKQMKEEIKAAISGYIHPLQRKRRKAYVHNSSTTRVQPRIKHFPKSTGFGKRIPVIPGPIGLCEAYIFREILNEKTLRSATEDLEITLEMQNRGFQIGYTNEAKSSTIAHLSFNAFWT